MYRDGTGRELTAQPVLASAVPRGAAGPVLDLSVEPLPATDGRLRVRLSWSAGEHDEVEIRRGDREPPWGPGERIGADQARSYGADLPGTPSVHGGRATLDCTVPAGQHFYVPFSFGAGGAVAGRAQAMGSTAPVTSPQVRRTGDRLTVTWVWPAGIGLAQVRWTTASGPRSWITVSRAQYDAESGCVLPAEQGGGTVEIRAMAVGLTGSALSPAATCVVARRAARVAYSIGRPPPPPGKPLFAKLRDRVQDRQRIVALSSDEACDGLEVVVVAAPGVAMPRRAEQGTELARRDGVGISPGVPVSIPFEMPASFSRPYWIRCFVRHPDGLAVTDPPIDQMKVS